MVEIDVRGLSCPIPVVRTKKAIEEYPNEVITVLTDSAVSKENVSRLAQSMGYSVQVDQVSDEYHLKLSNK